MDKTTVQFYEKNAAEIATRYETVASPVERYFGAAFVAGSRILDTQSQLVRCLQFLAPLSKLGFFTHDEGR